MLAELKLEIESSGLTLKQSSNLHGLMMENLAPAYSEKLHGQGRNPFSQCLLEDGKGAQWCIRTLTEEAYDSIITPLSRLEAFELKGGKIKARVLGKTIRTIPKERLLERFYEPGGEHYQDILFQTPTAFKSGGRYVFYPDPRLIYQSLMKKYSAASDELEMEDGETLDQLTENSEIVRYRLRTVPFSLEGVMITGFQGQIRIHIRGSDTMARYVRLLLEFGEYSGIGIKTGLGMGAINLVGRDATCRKNG